MLYVMTRMWWMMIIYYVINSLLCAHYYVIDYRLQLSLSKAAFAGLPDDGLWILCDKSRLLCDRSRLLCDRSRFLWNSSFFLDYLLWLLCGRLCYVILWLLRGKLYIILWLSTLRSPPSRWYNKYSHIIYHSIPIIYHIRIIIHDLPHNKIM